MKTPTEPVLNTDDLSERKNTLIKPSGITLRHKISVGFGGLLLLMAVSMGITLLKMSDVEKVAETVIDHRQPAVQLLLNFSQKINLATTLLNGYLLTGHIDDKKVFLSVNKQISQNFRVIKKLAASSNLKIQLDTLNTAEILLSDLQIYAMRLIELRDNTAENFPGMALVTESIAPLNLEFIGLINEFISETQDNDRTEKQKQSLMLLNKTRYNWTQVINSLRIFFSTHIFYIDSANNQLQNFRNYSDLVGDTLNQLKSMDVDIGFDGIEQLVEIHSKFLHHIPTVIELFQSEAWRSDAYIMKTELRPIVEELRNILQILATTQTSYSKKEGQALTKTLEQIRLSTIIILFVATIIGTLLAVTITQGIIPPIRRLMEAAGKVAAGDLDVVVNIGTRDEIGLLGNSFNAMVNDLHTKENDKQKFMQELTELNLDLEFRVKRRTIELETNENRIRAILDNIGEGIVAINDAGYIDSLNPAAERIFGLSDANCLEIHSVFLAEDSVLHALVDIGEYKEDIHSPFQPGTTQQPIELLGKRSDLSCFPMEVVVTEMKSGEKVLRVCIVRDISRRKETEQRLEKVQKQLLDTAHKSGMADIATGVLHNIGNILNSVNLSGEEIARTISTSKYPGLLKANKLLEENLDHIGYFLTEDQKGKQLPNYYSVLGKSLKEDFEKISTETSELTQKIAMMKDVINTQQSYARTEFYSEKINIERIIEDALRVESASLEKSNIHIIKQYSDLPKCRVQKAKILQVFTNLIKNAKEAIREKDTSDPERLITVKTALVNDLEISVSVTDSGCGIDNINLKNIFNHGFTTKETGHGYGLHTSANAMTEMGGKLSADSKGKNCGSTFTVTIPLSKNRNPGNASQESPPRNVKIESIANDA